MSGSGGIKHRVIVKLGKRTQHQKKARANVARVKNQFEQRGQTWDPANNGQQMAALNHSARRLLSRSPYQNH